MTSGRLVRRARRAFIPVALICLWLVAAMLPVNAGGLGAARAETVAANRSVTLRVGWFDQPGYMEMDSNGQPGGYLYEYLQSISQQTGWKIKRVSLKVRNEARAIPDAWEKAALEDFDKRAAAGEPPMKLEKGEKVGDEYRYVKALPVQPLCLSCHGPSENLSPGIKAALGQHYPNDRATGYSEGQIRGVISVRKKL